MSTAVSKPEQKPQGGTLSTVKGWLQSAEFQDAIARALPKHMTPERFIRIAITATMTSPLLLKCSQESLFGCLLKLSQYGLEPDGRHAHLIPFKNNKANTYECTLIIDYKGLAKLVMQSGLVSNIDAQVVCENDVFKFDRGAVVRHEIDFKNPRGEAYAAYAVIRFKDGTEKTDILSKEEILSIRDRSQGWISFKKGYAKQSPWDPAAPFVEREMWKKTAFRRASKWVPLSAEIRDAIAQGDEDDIVNGAIQTEATQVSSQSKSDALADQLAQRLLEQEERDREPGDETETEGTEPTREAVSA